MGANTYIGNAPNFMVKSMSDENGVRMPSFFGYMAWSLTFLIPVFIIDMLVFFFSKEVENMENKNKYYDIAERIYDLDGEVYECVGSSLGRTFTGDKRTLCRKSCYADAYKATGHLLRSELRIDQ